MSSRSDRSRAAILEAAETLFLERGFHLIGMEQIAAAAGLSRQAVYLHFKSRTGLLIALLDEVGIKRGLPELVEEVKRASTAAEALDRAVTLHVQYDARIHDVARALYEARREDPAAAAAWTDRMALRRRGLRTVVEWLAREDALDATWTVAEATDLLWAVLSPHSFEYLVLEAGWSLERYEQHLRTLLHRSLLTRPQPFTEPARIPSTK